MTYPKEPGKLLDWLKANFEGKQVDNSRSGAGNWLKFTLDKLEKGNAELSLTVREDMSNPYNNIHGGMMCHVIDEAIGWAVVSLDTALHYTSMNLSVDFLYAVKQGERITAKSVVIRAGKKIINAECSVYNETGYLVAKAHSNLVTTNMPIKD
jgi:acyl-coenzyme A thioesterase 13